jgi:hypothetical protein
LTQTSRQGRVNRTIPIRFSFDEGLDVGKDTGTPVTNDYAVSFTFTGGIGKVTSDIKFSLYHRARQLIGDETAVLRPPHDHWSCPDCGERREHQFAACWKCDATMDFTEG